MTVLQLYRRLTKLMEQSHGRKQVLISKTTFTHPLEEDGCTLLPVEKTEIRTYPVMDADGGSKLLADGSECYRTALILMGGSQEGEGI